MSATVVGRVMAAGVVVRRERKMDAQTLQDAVARFGTDVALVIDGWLERAYAADHEATRVRMARCMRELRVVRGYVGPGRIPTEWLVPFHLTGQL